MAKMFYTMEETKAALGKNEEEIKQLAREGRLREFRDGPRLMFKADQVEQVKAELAGGGGDALSLAPSDDAPISLAGDSSVGGGPGITGVGGGKKEDTQFADIGLSGSLGGTAAGSKAGTAAGSPGLTGTGMGTSAGAARGGGITIFDVDESQKADPSAQTAINSGVQEQVSLESVGSGSGLLDLTRESDDTSLGAVFDELNPPAAGARRGGGVAAAPQMESASASELGAVAVERAAPPMMSAPIYVERPDAVATALGAGALVAAAITCIGGFLLCAAVIGARPEIMDSLDLNNNGSGKIYFIAAIGMTLIATVVGYFVGKMGTKTA